MLLLITQQYLKYITGQLEIMSLKSHYVSFNSKQTFEIFTMQLIQNYLQAVLWRSVTKKEYAKLMSGSRNKAYF